MIKKCPYCRKQPVSFKSSTDVNGYTVQVHIIECDNYEDDSVLPFVEHRLSVYSKDEQEAINRWNDVVPEVTLQ